MTFSAAESDDSSILGLKNCGIVPLLANQTPYWISSLNQQDLLWTGKLEYGDQFVILSACWKYIVSPAILWSRFIRK